MIVSIIHVLGLHRDILPVVRIGGTLCCRLHEVQTDDGRSVAIVAEELFPSPFV